MPRDARRLTRVVPALVADLAEAAPRGVSSPQAVFVFCLTTAMACSSPASPAAPGPVEAASTDGRSSSPSITELALADSRFSTLVQAVSKAGLVDFFDGRPHYTVFAPTNTAFDLAAAELGYTDGPALVDALSVKALTGILQYHVTRGDRRATSVVNAGTLRMLDGNTTMVTLSGPNALINGVLISEADLLARNGVVHVIDGVLLP